jgi:putative sigma-54 modulation protein
MKVNVTFRHLDPDPELKSYVEEKLIRMCDKYFQRPQEAAVVFSAEKFRRIAEITIKVDNTMLVGREETEDTRSALDLALDKLEIQARKYRGKFKDKKRSTLESEVAGSSGESMGEVEDEDSGPRVFVDDTFVPKPLTVEDAVLALDHSRDSFIVFRNADSLEVCVLYRRPDGNYGLIETKG